jgi:FkbM family methyltransferase
MFKSLFRKIKYLLEIAALLQQLYNPLSAILLFIFSRNTEVITRGGTRFTVSHFLDLLTIKEIYFDNSYQLKLKNPKVILDIGANIGTFSVLASKKYPKATVYAFDPAREVYKLLVQNIRANSCDNVIPKKMAVGAKKGKTYIYAYSASGLSSISNKRTGGRKEVVKTLGLKDIFNNNDIRYCDFLKMDCEGSEYNILFNTPRSLLLKIEMLAIEYHNSLLEYTGDELAVFLRNNGYKVRVSEHHLEPDIGIIYAKR